MEIQSTAMGPALADPQDSASNVANAASSAPAGSSSAGTSAASSDTVTFSEAALALAEDIDSTVFTSTMVKTKFGDDVITFNNVTGEITWNGNKLDLKGNGKIHGNFGDPLKVGDVVFQKDGNIINVYEPGVANFGTFYADTGKRVINSLGNWEIPSTPLDESKPMLIIHNSWSVTFEHDAVYGPAPESRENCL